MDDSLMLRDIAHQQLMQIKNIESGIEYLSKVKTIETWARAEKKDAELQLMIAEQKIRTQRILGRLIKEGQAAGEIARAGGDRDSIVRESDNRNDLKFSDANTKLPKKLAELGITRNESSAFQRIASIPDDVFEKEIQDKKSAVNKAVSELTTAGMVALARKTEVDIKNEAIRQSAIDKPNGKFDVIVIDPPWPMEKIEREVSPNQVGLDYPTMTEDELRSIAIPYEENCHIWLWTTHKFLPMAFRLLDAWQMKYVCTFVWHKNGGFQPFGLPQYNCEFALYARIGTPQFIDTKAFPVCFDADRTGHSEKPENFYDIVRRVTGGRRLDMFNRRSIEGFETWGNESQ